MYSHESKDGNQTFSSSCPSLASQSLLGYRAFPEVRGWVGPIFRERHRVTCLPTSARDFYVPAHWLLCNRSHALANSTSTLSNHVHACCYVENYIMALIEDMISSCCLASVSRRFRGGKRLGTCHTNACSEIGVGKNNVIHGYTNENNQLCS